MISEWGFWPRFVLAVLAAWRVSHSLAKEDGPADFIARIRTRFNNGLLGKLMDCVYCLSLWVAAPMAFYVSRKPIDLLLSWLAISGAVCLLERMNQEPVVIEPLTLLDEGGENDGMLR